MDLTALRERVQPALTQDFDAVRSEFVEETGSDDPRAFVRHLRTWSLIPNELADALLAELPGAPPPAPTPAQRGGASIAVAVTTVSAGSTGRTPAPNPLAVDVPTERASERSVRISLSQPPAADGGVFDEADEPSRPPTNEQPIVRGNTVPPTSMDHDVRTAVAPSLASARPPPRTATSTPPTRVSAQSGQSTPPPATPTPAVRVKVARAPAPVHPDEDSTHVMSWDDDSGEVDPEAATKHMDRSEVFAELAEHGGQSDDATAIRAIGKPSEPARPLGAFPDPFAGQGEPSGAIDDESADLETDMVDRTESIQLVDPIGIAPLGAVGPAAAAPNPAPIRDRSDPEADTLHIARVAGANGVEIPADGDRSGLDRKTLVRRATPRPVERAFGPSAGEAETPDDPVGRYRFGALIAQDGLARTFEAVDEVIGRTVWVRMMNDEVVLNPILLRRFKAEAKITASLVHPTVPTVLELRGDYAYVQAPHDGPTLAAVLADAREAHTARRPLPPDAVRDALLTRFLRVCEGVSYAHSRGLLHRDLRPESIVLGTHGSLWILDWGIARRMPGADPTLAVEGVDEDPRVLIGTPGHCSPEQANGNHAALDPRSDVYALGLVLFEMLTLKPAVSGISPSAKLGRQQLGQYDPLVHAFGTPIPAGLAAIVKKALERHPSDRYTNVDALAEDVRRALRGEDGGLLAAAGRSAGRHPALLLAVGVALGLGWVVAAVALVVGFV